MHCRRGIAVLAGLMAAMVLSKAGGAPQVGQLPQAAPGAAAQQEGVEVLARGPIHEAFAKPVQASQEQATPRVPKQPPEPVDEIPSDQKPEGDDVQWIPGYWAWEDERSDFIWISGFWRVPPPGRQWMPGYWQRIDSGWQWVAGFWAPLQQTEVTYLPPPPEPLEAGPSVPAPSEASVFVPGCWVYREARYYWRPGYWVDYRPGWIWVAPSYVWTPIGCIFVEGYWDLDLHRRGVLFAPVFFTANVIAQPNWFYQPRYVVAQDFLLTALFVRPAWRQYYFGDYFETTYQRGGFVPWVDYRVGRVAADPLFSYYRWRSGEGRRWEQDVRQSYTARFQGEAPRPPRTLVQQTNVIQNLTTNNQILINNKTVQVTNVQNVIKNVTVLAPVSQADKVVNVRLQQVPEEMRVRERQDSQLLRQASQQRRQLEVVDKDRVPARADDKPRTVKMELPPVRPGSRQQEGRRPPPPPTAPQAVTKPAPDRPVQDPRTTRPGTEAGRQPGRAEPAQPGAAPKERPMPTPREAQPEPRPTPRPDREPPRPQVQPPVPRPGQPEPRPEPRRGEPGQPPATPKETPRPPRPEPPARPDPTAPINRGQPETPRPPARPEAPRAPEAPRTQPAPMPQPAPRPAPEPRPMPMPQPPAARPQPAPQPMPTPQPAPRPMPESRPQPRPMPMPQPPPMAQPAPRPQPAPQPPPMAQPAPRPQPQPQPQPAPQPAPRPMPESRPQPRPQPAPQPPPMAQPAPRPQPAPQPPPMAQPAPRPQPAPQPPPMAQPAPRPQPQPAPQPAPRAEPPGRPPQGNPPGREGRPDRGKPNKDRDDK